MAMPRVWHVPRTWSRSPSCARTTTTRKERLLVPWVTLRTRQGVPLRARVTGAGVAASKKAPSMSADAVRTVR